MAIEIFLLYLSVHWEDLIEQIQYLGGVWPEFVQVLENLESPGIFLWHFPGLDSPGKRALVLESSANLLNSAKKYEVYGRE